MYIANEVKCVFIHEREYLFCLKSVRNVNTVCVDILFILNIGTVFYLFVFNPQSFSFILVTYFSLTIYVSAIDLLISLFPVSQLLFVTEPMEFVIIR